MSIISAVRSLMAPAPAAPAPRPVTQSTRPAPNPRPTAYEKDSVQFSGSYRDALGDFARTELAPPVYAIISNNSAG